ncbi:hypothetical protein ACFX2J_023582 [Malus domestica]
MEDTIAARFDGLHVGPVIMMSFRLARLPRDYTYKWVFYHSMKQSEHESMVRCMSLSNSSSALSLSLLRYLLLEYVCCCRSTGNQVLHILKTSINFFMFFSGEKPLERGRMKISLLGVMKELGRKNRVLPSDLFNVVRVYKGRRNTYMILFLLALNLKTFIVIHRTLREYAISIHIDGYSC